MKRGMRVECGSSTTRSYVEIEMSKGTPEGKKEREEMNELRRKLPGALTELKKKERKEKPEKDVDKHQGRDSRVVCV